MLTAEKNDKVLQQAVSLVQPGLFIQYNLKENTICFTPNSTHGSLGLKSECLSLTELQSALDPESFDTIKELTNTETKQFKLLFTTDKQQSQNFYCVAQTYEDIVYITGTPANNFFSRNHAENEAEQLKKEMEEFSYIASHDLQEPLRKVSTYVERMMDKLPEEEKQNLSVYTDRIGVSLANMRNLIDDLLQFSRSAKQPQHIEKINLNELLNRSLVDNELKIEESKAKIYLQPLPDAEGDASQLLQVFNNLLTNALKFTRPNEAPVVYIYAEPLNESDKLKLHSAHSNYIKIMIRDEGIGFDQSFDNKIFQMFHRLNPKHAYTGSGIGLAICKKIVSNHNGFITAESDGKNGSIFSVILPEKQK
jgi:signal transduction histidine kinase